ncbi:MAG TPA: hypothetical protein VK971_10035 [Thiohalobacter sp.]|nr:hypothetical protein [Thiohalobacter sp.]
MTTNDYSLENFNKFLDYVLDKGLMKPETAKGRKRAANTILGILEPEETQDLRSIDLDHVAHRFANLQGGSFKPASLKVYQTRTRSALTDFFQYVENPIGFKPSVAQRTRKSSGDGKKSDKKQQGKPKNVTPQQPAPPNPNELHDKTDTHDKLVFPIPIRPGLIVKVSNIPADLTQTEAEKIAAVVTALAVVNPE